MRVRQKMILDNINTIIARIVNPEIPAAKSKFENISTYDDLKSLLMTDFSSALDRWHDNCKIWRGMSQYGSMFIATPGIRKSQNTGNIYTRMLSDILPNWKDYPKRNRSFICSSSQTTAIAYGKEYLILPENGAKIGICPTSDIWSSFRDSVGILPNLNHTLYTMFSLACYRFGKNYDSDVFESIDNTAELLSLFELVDKYIDITSHDDLYIEIYTEKCKDIIMECKDKKIPILKQLEIKLDPKINNFKLETIEKYDINEQSMNYEVWTDSRCLFINESKLKDLLIAK